jgi:hypothetical protein
MKNTTRIVFEIFLCALAGVVFGLMLAYAF